MPSPAVAAPVGGDSEVQISGGAFHAQGSDTGAFNAELSYGYFFNSAWELGVRQGYNYTYFDKSRDFWTLTTTPFIHFNLPFGIFVPYVGGGIGAAYNDRDFTGVIGPDAGVKIFLNPQTFLKLGYRYEYFFDRFKDVDNNSNHGNHIGAIGIGFVWGGTRTTK